MEMNALEEQTDNDKDINLYWKPLSWASKSVVAKNTAWTFVWLQKTLHGLKCGCKKHCMDFHGDQTSTCTAHSGATKMHDWMVGVLGPLFRTAGHTVRTQHGVTASADQRRCDVELSSYLQDSAGRRILVFDLSMTHDRFGSSSHVQQNDLLRISRTSMRLYVLLRSAKLTDIGNNMLTIRTFLFSPPLSAQAHACTKGIVYFCRKIMQNYSYKLPKMAKLV
jgi:hypothetical protein